MFLLVNIFLMKLSAYLYNFIDNFAVFAMEKPFYYILLKNLETFSAL